MEYGIGLLVVLFVALLPFLLIEHRLSRIQKSTREAADYLKAMSGQSARAPSLKIRVCPKCTAMLPANATSCQDCGVTLTA